MNINIVLLIIFAICNIVLDFITNLLTKDYRKNPFLRSSRMIFVLLKIYRKKGDKKYLYLFILDVLFIIGFIAMALLSII